MRHVLRRHVARTIDVSAALHFALQRPFTEECTFARCGFTALSRMMLPSPVLHLSHRTQKNSGSRKTKGPNSAQAACIP